VRADVRRSTGNNNSYVGLDCGRGQQVVFVPVSWASQWLTVVVSARVKQGTCTITLHTDADGGEWTNFDNIRLESGAPQLSVLGADVSSLKKSEDLGGVYLDNSHGNCAHPGDALAILANHGADLIRLRVWVNPADGHHTLAEAALMAKRAHETSTCCSISTTPTPGPTPGTRPNPRRGRAIRRTNSARRFMTTPMRSARR
jgi:arabinogalactan endo-1,4-beta-galactosidase